MAGVTGRFFPTHGHHMGQGGSFAAFNEASLSPGGAGPFAGHLGQVVEDNGKVYRLVQHDKGTGSVATTVGGACHWKTRASYIVSSDQANAEAGYNSVAGAYLKAAVTDQYYCYVQMGGVQAVVVDTTAAAGTALTATSTDLTLVAITTNTLGNQLIYAISYGTNTTTSANAYWVMGNLL